MQFCLLAVDSNPSSGSILNTKFLKKNYFKYKFIERKKELSQKKKMHALLLPIIILRCLTVGPFLLEGRQRQRPAASSLRIRCQTPVIMASPVPRTRTFEPNGYFHTPLLAAYINAPHRQDPHSTLPA